MQGFAFTHGLGNANIGTQQLFATTTYHYADNVTLIRGRHMMKMGGNILRQQMNVFYCRQQRPQRVHQLRRPLYRRQRHQPDRQTRRRGRFRPRACPTISGRGLSTGTWGQRKTIYGFYFQDDWRATNRLTLNLGLRWEYHTPLVEVKDRQSNFGLFTGELELAGKNGNSRALYNPLQEGFPAARRLRIYARTTEDGAPRRVHDLFVHGRHRHQSAAAAEPAVQLRSSRRSTTRPPTSCPATTLDQGLSGLSANDPYKGANIRLWDPNVRPAERPAVEPDDWSSSCPGRTC